MSFTTEDPDGKEVVIRYDETLRNLRALCGDWPAMEVVMDDVQLCFEQSRETLTEWANYDPYPKRGAVDEQRTRAQEGLSDCINAVMDLYRGLITPRDAFSIIRSVAHSVEGDGLAIVQGGRMEVP